MTTQTLQQKLRDYASCQAEKMRVEIYELVVLTEIAEAYEVDEAELQQAAVDPALFDRRPRGGSEGAPTVSEFLALEIATAAGMPATQAAQQIHQALDLKYRHPHLWAEVLDGRVRVWQALKVASKVSASGLSLLNVSVVDERFVQRTSELPFNRAMRALDGLIVEADPELAQQQVRKAAERRCVVFHPTRDGSTDLYATLDAADAIRLKSTTLQLAQYLKDSGDTDPLELRQARALGLLATPARALAILQAHLDEHPRVPAQTVTYHACSDAPGPVRNVTDAEAHIEALIASLTPTDRDSNATRERRNLDRDHDHHEHGASHRDPIDDADLDARRERRGAAGDGGRECGAAHRDSAEDARTLTCEASGATLTGITVTMSTEPVVATRPTPPTLTRHTSGAAFASTTIMSTVPVTATRSMMPTCTATAVGSQSTPTNCCPKHN